jgi:hypothetical protein
MGSACTQTKNTNRRDEENKAQPQRRNEEVGEKKTQEVQKDLKPRVVQEVKPCKIIFLCLLFCSKEN